MGAAVVARLATYGDPAAAGGASRDGCGVAGGR